MLQEEQLHQIVMEMRRLDYDGEGADYEKVREWHQRLGMYLAQREAADSIKPLAEVVSENWPVVAQFFAERNWPDTKLGNAARALSAAIPKIIAQLRLVVHVVAQPSAEVVKAECVKICINHANKARSNQVENDDELYRRFMAIKGVEMDIRALGLTRVK